VYFETQSGNIYKIYQVKHRMLGVIDARSNRGAKASLMGHTLSSGEISQSCIRVGSRFVIGNKVASTVVVKIIAVTGKHFTTGEPEESLSKSIADHETSGNMSDIGRRFESEINASD